MTIKIKEKDGIAFKLWLPTSLLKSKLILSIINKYSNDVDLSYLEKILPIIYTSITDYSKENGHFTLIDITSSDGASVKIKV